MRTICRRYRHYHKFALATDHQLRVAFQCIQNAELKLYHKFALTTDHQLRVAFQCIQNAELKLSREKCHYGTTEVDFLGRTNKPNSFAPQKRKLTKFLEEVKFPCSKKALQRYSDFLTFHRSYIPRLAGRLKSSFQLLKTTEDKDKIIITPELINECHQIIDFLE